MSFFRGPVWLWGTRAYLLLVAALASVGAVWTWSYWSRVLGSEMSYFAAFGQVAALEGTFTEKLKGFLFIGGPMLCGVAVILVLGVLFLTRFRPHAALAATAAIAAAVITVAWIGLSAVHDIEYPGYWSKSSYVQTYWWTAIPVAWVSKLWLVGYCASLVTDRHAAASQRLAASEALSTAA